MFPINENSNQPKIVYSTRGDVNGDGVIDNIYLIGTTTSDSPFVQNITLVIENSRNDILIYEPLQENAGYQPRIFLGDFTGDGVNDILISIDSGGSGGIMYHYIYSIIDNKLYLLFDSDRYNEQFKYTVVYKDNYRVEVTSQEDIQGLQHDTDNQNNIIRYVLDITLKDREYLDEIYDQDGRLKAPIEGFVNPLSGLYPVDFDADNVYELLAYQKIAGRYNADALGYMLNTLKWEKQAFQLAMQNVAIYGSETF